MKIAFVQRHLSSKNGGEERSLFSLIRNLPDDIDPVLLTNLAGDYSEILENGGRKVHFVEIQEWSLYRTSGFIKSLLRAFIKLKNEHLDLIHVNSYKDITWSYFLAILLRVPVSLHLRLNAPDYLSKQYKFSIKRAKLLIANSEFVKSDWEKHLDTNIHVVWNGLESGSFKFSAKNFKEPIKILFIGRLVVEKGIKLLPDAFKLFKKENNAKLRIVGSAKQSVERGEINYQNWLEDKLKSHIDTGMVEIRGHDSEPLKHFEWADFVWIPSYHDTFGRTLMEAMATGCIPVASDVGESKNIKILNNCKFQEGSSDDLALKTTQLLQSDLSDCSKSMYLYATNHFSINDTANNCALLFKEIKK